MRKPCITFSDNLHPMHCLSHVNQVWIDYDDISKDLLRSHKTYWDLIHLTFWFDIRHVPFDMRHVTFSIWHLTLKLHDIILLNAIGTKWLNEQYRSFLKPLPAHLLHSLSSVCSVNETNGSTWAVSCPPPGFRTILRATLWELYSFLLRHEHRPKAEGTGLLVGSL